MVVAENKIIGILIVFIGFLILIVGFVFSGAFNPGTYSALMPVALILIMVIGILVIVLGILFYRKE